MKLNCNMKLVLRIEVFSQKDEKYPKGFYEPKEMVKVLQAPYHLIPKK